jgi:hypothetical protein
MKSKQKVWKEILLDTIPFPPPDVTMVCDNDWFGVIVLV